MVSKVKKIGGSVAVVIPRALANEYDLSEGTTLDIVGSQGGILIRRSGRRARRPLSEITAKLSKSAYATQVNALGDAPPVGREVW